MQYTIRHASVPLGAPTAELNPALWSTECISVDHFPWEDSGHRPKVCARALWDEHFLAVRFDVEDRYVRAVAQNFNDSVCLDSCVEFFVAPSADPAQDAYFNFEVNCGGTILLHRCASGAERAAGGSNDNVTAEDGATIRMAHTLPKIVEPELEDPTNWAIEYHVPWSLFEAYFGAVTPSAGTTWRANFYKCGDRTSHPHWASWSPVDTPRPNFHQPAFFQPIHFA
mgnify:CR=1 FL=1|jgi:hypothetical protein